MKNRRAPITICALMLLLIPSLVSAQARSVMQFPITLASSGIIKSSAVFYRTSFEPGDTSYTVLVARTLAPLYKINNDPTFVYSGTQSLHIKAVKDLAWDGNTSVTPSGSVGYCGVYWEYDTIPPYNPYNLDVTVGHSVPDQVGTWHWTADYIFPDSSSPTGYDWESNFDPRCRVYRAYPDPLADMNLTSVYTRLYFYLLQLDGYVQIVRYYGHFADASTGSYIAVIDISLGYVRAGIGMKKNDGVTQPDWLAYDKNGNVFSGTGWIVAPLTLNEWHSIEFHFKRPVPEEPNYPYSGGIQVWVDEQLIIDRLDLDTSGAPGKNGPIVGLVLTDNSLDFYIDDFMVDTNYMGG